MSSLRLCLCQMSVGSCKATNVKKAISFIDKAKQQGADIVVLPTKFDTPFGSREIKDTPEIVPTGETCIALSNAAKKNEIYVIGGSIPERDGNRVFNTCTVWNPQGEFITKYRKIHLFEIDIKGKVTISESKNTDAGKELATFEVKGWKIGLGICHDIRFEEMAKLYRKQGCHLLVYPGMFNIVTGPVHWSLLGRSRANDNQMYVACVSSARIPSANFTVYGHTQLINPWGEVVAELDTTEDMIVKDIDMKVVEELREQLAVFDHRRTDIYDTISKKAYSNDSNCEDSKL